MINLQSLQVTLAGFGISHLSSTTIGKETTLYFKSKISIPSELLENIFPEPVIEVDDIEDVLKKSKTENLNIPAYQYIIKYTQ